MSLALAKAWVNATIRQPQPQVDALRFLDRTEAGAAVGTMIIGPQLSHSGQCFLGRWDGRELVVLELTSEQQHDWTVDPRGLYQEVRPTSWPTVATPAETLTSLEVKHVEGEDDFGGWKPVSGICIAEPQTTPHQLIHNCAIRAQYFRPHLRSLITSMWYADNGLYATRAELHFRLPPLFSGDNPQTFHGAIVVFMQLFAADDWSRQIGCRSISNVTHTMLSMR